MGEDPFLTGILATEYVKGLQSKKILATGKHFLLNNHEWLRHHSDIIIDERTIREFYGRPWYRLAQEAELGAVMGSYNLVNGKKACQNKELLQDLLKDEMQFKGLIMSDWGAVWNGTDAAMAGLDLIMGDGFYYIPENEADRAKLEEKLTASCMRILTTCFKFGFYDRDRITKSFLKDIKKYEATALHTARRAVTLLQNQNNTLPIKEKKIMVIGQAKTYYAGGGSGSVKGYDHQNVLDELKKIYGQDNVWRNERPKDEEIKKAKAVVILVRTEDGEHGDKPFQLARKEDLDLLNRATKLHNKVAVVLFSGRGTSMDGWGDKAGAILHCYYPGQTGAQAIAEIIAGKVNPSGKLPFTIEYKFSDSPAADYRPEGAGWGDTRKTAFEKELPKFIKHEYKEGVFVGYRWYEKKKKPVRFPFGHGLSYTSFQYSDLKIDTGKTIQVKFKIKNTGKTEGAEVAQAYFTSPESKIERPLKELCGFKKVDLKSGNSKTVIITIHPEDISYYDVGRKLWVTPKGAYNLVVGSSSKDIRLKGSFKLKKDQTFTSPVPK
jgi:beta-glucosidase